MGNQKILTIHYRFEGRVQGVGFRQTAKYFAQKHNLKGFVRNKFDGSVEAVVQGEEHCIKNWEKDLHDYFSKNIKNIVKKQEKTEKTNLFSTFSIESTDI